MSAAEIDAAVLERGERVLLRRPTERDRKAFIAVRLTSRAHLEPWEPIPPEGFDAWGDDMFDRELKRLREPGEDGVLICAADDASIVGRVSVQAIERGVLQSCRLGYWIAGAACGRGYMTEALRLMLRHCFLRLGLHRVSADVQPGNEPSRRALLRAGFWKVGYSPRLVKIRGVWSDHEHYAITREQWGDDPMRGAEAV